MKISYPALLWLAPLSLVVVMLGSPPLAASAPAPTGVTQGPPCVPEVGGNQGACAELVELVVHDVVPLEEAQAHVVVLVTKDGQRVLPLFVDEAAAVAIAFRLAHVEPPQPLAQDLLGDVVQELGGKVTEVRIDDVREDIYTGRLFLQQGRRKLALEARPSDSIALAMDGHARIFATRKVLDVASLSREDIESFHKEEAPGVGGSGEPEPDPKAPHPPVTPDPLPTPLSAPDKQEIKL